MSDYIRRILAKAQFTGNFQSEYPTALIHALLDDVPSEDVRPVVRGRWINQRADSEMCSACGVRFYISALFAVGGNDEPNYCPNCGARMEES